LRTHTDRQTDTSTDNKGRLELAATRANNYIVRGRGSVCAYDA